MAEQNKAIAFIDGQNLFRTAWDAYGDGYHFPSYDVQALAEFVCKANGLGLREVRFYSGVPAVNEDPLGHHVWRNRIASMKRAGVTVVTRPLRYEDRVVEQPDGSLKHVRKGREKGIDVRIALDLVDTVLEKRCDAVVLFSQDQDLKEAVVDMKRISQAQERKVGIFCAFPQPQDNKGNHRGVDGTTWFKIPKSDYDRCRDLADYRKGYFDQSTKSFPFGRGNV